MDSQSVSHSAELAVRVWPTGLIGRSHRIADPSTLSLFQHPPEMDVGFAVRGVGIGRCVRARALVIFVSFPRCCGRLRCCGNGRIRHGTRADLTASCLRHNPRPLPSHTFVGMDARATVPNSIASCSCRSVCAAQCVLCCSMRSESGSTKAILSGCSLNDCPTVAALAGSGFWSSVSTQIRDGCASRVKSAPPAVDSPPVCGWSYIL